MAGAPMACSVNKLKNVVDEVAKAVQQPCDVSPKTRRDHHLCAERHDMRIIDTSSRQEQFPRQSERQLQPAGDAGGVARGIKKGLETEHLLEGMAGKVERDAHQDAVARATITLIIC